MNADEAHRVHANASQMMQQVRDAQTETKAAKHDISVLEKRLAEAQVEIEQLTQIVTDRTAKDYTIEAYKAEIERLKANFSDKAKAVLSLNVKLRKHREFVAADEALEEVNQNEPHPPSDPRWIGWLDKRNKAIQQKNQARQKLEDCK